MWWPPCCATAAWTLRRSSPGGTAARASVREMLLDMIEEYARHTGHADLLRESVDGLVGEGAPADFRI